VDAAESRERGLRHRVDCGRIGDIRHDCLDLGAPGAETVGLTFESCGIDVDQHHSHARRREGIGDAQPDARRGPGHDGHLSGELLHGTESSSSVSSGRADGFVAGHAIVAGRVARCLPLDDEDFGLGIGVQ
jgi:hypothetical protein